MTEPLQVLIVDDEPALLKMMGLYLKRKGYAVTTADTTDGAWEKARGSAFGFTAAVVDASMRGLTATDLGLRLLDASPSICVILASGYPVDMSRLQEVGPGRVVFLQKPFTPESLDGTLRRMIASQEEDV